MKTVAIIEGFAGGPMLTREFRSYLAKAGFKVNKNRREADVIVAHSAGIYSIPNEAKAKLLILIGPTYWPHKHILKRLYSNNLAVARDHIIKFGWRSYGRKKALETYYLFRRHKYLWSGLRNNNRLDHLNKIIRQPSRKVIVIRNRYDKFCTPDIKKLVEDGGAIFAEMPGHHDDFMINPKPYVDLILKEL